MKKLFAMLLVVGMFSFIACGPTAEEKAAQAAQDSIAMADSLAKVAADAAIADLIAKADSIAKVTVTPTTK